MFFKAEKIIFLLMAVTLGWTFCLALQSPMNIVWSGFLLASALPMLLVALAIGLRTVPSLQVTSVALMMLGLYAIHSNVIAILTYLNFPLSRPMIDHQLLALDAALGYSWPDAVAWLARYPLLGLVMKYVYLSSLVQIVVLMAVLSLLARRDRLMELVLCGMVSVMTTVAFWSLWPSFGPSAYFDIPGEIAAQAHLVVRSDYGAHLLHLAEHGMVALESHMMLGAVAFPSFHTVMMLMVIMYARGTIMFWPALALNLLMLPAIAIHGGHHLTDILGGGVVFLLSAWITARAVQADHPRLAAPLVPESLRAGRLYLQRAAHDCLVALWPRASSRHRMAQGE